MYPVPSGSPRPTLPTEGRLPYAWRQFSLALLGFLRWLERFPYALLAVLVPGFVWTVAAMFRRPLWYDELYTCYLSELPLHAIWPALRHGADLNPPLVYWMTHASFAVFGVSEAAARLPEGVGFTVACVCLGWFVARRSTVHYGLAAAIFPMLSPDTYYYVAEARPYGLLLGFGSVALLAWQYAAEPKHRRIALPVLFGSLTLAVTSHYYGVFLIGALGLGELTRVVVRRRVDWPVWACLTAPILIGAQVFFLSTATLVTRSGIRGNHFLSARPGSIVHFYNDLLKPLLWPLLGAALIATARWNSPLDETSPDRSARFWKTPAHEITCLIALSLLPVLICASAILRHDVFTLRYGLLGVLGISAIVVLFVFFRTGGSAAGGAALSLLFAAVFLEWVAVYGYSHILRQPPKPPSPYAEAPPNLPLVVSNGLMFLQAQQYEPQAVADHLFFVTDRSTALRETGTAIFDAGLYNLQKWHPLRGHVQSYRAFLAAHPQFFVYGPYVYPEDWLLPHLLRDQCDVRLVSQHTSEWGPTGLFDVTCPR